MKDMILDRKTKKGMDKEMVLACAMLALIGGIAILLCYFFVFDIDITLCNKGKLLISSMVLSFLIWGILLFRNC